MSGAPLIDLHVHTTASDGGLSPPDLIAAALAAGVGLLAITDHDTLDAYDDLPAIPPGMTLIGGIELSTVWRTIGIHVLGLGVDVHHADLRAICTRHAAARDARAHAIAALLGRRGITDAYAGAAAQARGRPIGRPHFARHLVDCGAATTLAQAYQKYLRHGRAFHGLDWWAPLDEIVDCIRAAGGTAVLAHPAHYRLTAMRLGELLRDFTAAGGGALELISGTQTAAVTQTLARLAHRHGLEISLGSDFHHPEQTWNQLGRTPPSLPGLRPLWDKWQRATRVGMA